MPSPSYEDRICAMFDSFTKTVSRNFVRNLQRNDANIITIGGKIEEKQSKMSNGLFLFLCRKISIKF